MFISLFWEPVVLIQELIWVVVLDETIAVSIASLLRWVCTAIISMDATG
jgi:hypothetical protein